MKENELYFHNISYGEKTFTCQNCAVLVKNLSGQYSTYNDTNLYKNIIWDKKIKFLTLLCSNCGFYNLFVLDKDKKNENVFKDYLPTNKYSEEINNLEDNLKNLFNDIKFQANHGKWHLVLLLSRILIMHVGTKEGAKENWSFKKHIEHLESKNLVNRDLLSLINSIKEIGNDMNHKIDLYKNENLFQVEQNGQIIYKIVVDVLNHLYEHKAFIKEIKKTRVIKNN